MRIWHQGFVDFDTVPIYRQSFERHMAQAVGEGLEPMMHAAGILIQHAAYMVRLSRQLGMATSRTGPYARPPLDWVDHMRRANWQAVNSEDAFSGTGHVTGSSGLIKSQRKAIKSQPHSGNFNVRKERTNTPGGDRYRTGLTSQGRLHDD